MSAWTRTRPLLLNWIPIVIAAPLAILAWRGPSASGDGSPDRIARGEYLVATIGCDDCHTPKTMGPEGPTEDLTRRLSGHPEAAVLTAPPKLEGSWVGAVSTDLTGWAGPWGISYSFNLTPDENTGIGSWSEDTFVETLETGRHMGVSRPILPPMPWKFYRNLTDEDLRSIYAYLRTIPPVHNRVPMPVPPEEVFGATATAAGR